MLCTEFHKTEKFRSYKASEISTLQSVLNFEFKQILYITLFVAVDPYNRKDPYKIHLSRKLKALQAFKIWKK